jgi:hypothetical protein
MLSSAITAAMPALDAATEATKEFSMITDKDKDESAVKQAFSDAETTLKECFTKCQVCHFCHFSTRSRLINNIRWIANGLNLKQI